MENGVVKSVSLEPGSESPMLMRQRAAKRDPHPDGNDDAAGRSGSDHQDSLNAQQDDRATLRLYLPELTRANSRGRLFRNCNTHAQNAIIELRGALEAVGGSSSRRGVPSGLLPDYNKAEAHIKEALEVLLASGEANDADSAINALSSSFHKGLEEVSHELSAEVSEWLSATYSPRQHHDVRFTDPRQLSLLARHISEAHPAVAAESKKSPEAQKELQRALDWDNFDVFALQHHSGGHSLSLLAPHLFNHFGLYESLTLDKEKVKSFWRQVERGYRDVPYHNSVHAADVLQVVAWLLELPQLKQTLKPIEICAALVAAGIHDHDHPGVNNDFLIKTHHELAVLYNDKSVLENHHVSTGLRVLLAEENNFLGHLDKDSIHTFRQLVIAMVLATDMSSHFQLQADFKTTFEEKCELDTTVKRMLMMEQLIHCADISNCGKPFRLAERWGELVVTEFFNQGDKEQALGLPVSPMNNRNTNALERSQMAFIRHVVVPMLELIVAVLPATDIALVHANANVDNWNTRMERAQKEKAQKDAKEKEKEEGKGNGQENGKKAVEQKKGVVEKKGGEKKGAVEKKGVVEKKGAGGK